tara:strand:+ start:396 stop:566 length:171 start_codon:yes stop_codon:yes gene_type:complete
MIEILLTTSLLTCESSQEIVEGIMKYQHSSVDKEALVEVIKLNTEPTCYERPEHNS